MILAFAAATASPVCDAGAAEPIPAPACDEACMAERVARKQALLAAQDRKKKAGTAAVFGAEWQRGVRQSEPSSSSPLPFSNPFLLPGDVGGVNLQIDRQKK